MARYYLHLRDGHDELLDPDGIEYPDMDALRQGVLTTARDLIAGDVQEGEIDFRSRLDAEDEAGRVVHTLELEDAVTIRR
jgi:hypothetical protein